MLLVCTRAHCARMLLLYLWPLPPVALLLENSVDADEGVVHVPVGSRWSPPVSPEKLAESGLTESGLRVGFS